TLGQVRRVLLAEALAFGLLGAGLGLAGGMVLQSTLTTLIAHSWGIAPPTVAIPLPTALAGLAAGPLLALGAALAALHQSGSLAPLQALRGQSPPAAPHRGIVRTLIGLFLTAAALVVLASVGSSWVPASATQMVIGPALTAALIGCALLLPRATEAAL